MSPGTLAKERAGRAILAKKDKLQKRWKAAHYAGKSTAAIERMMGRLDAQLKALMRSNPARGRKMTKSQKRAKASRAAKTRGIVKAVKGLLKKTNPSAKITGASVVKLKGGVLKITPIRDNPGKAKGAARASAALAWKRFKRASAADRVKITHRRGTTRRFR